jgi:hypothetical protein
VGDNKAQPRHVALQLGQAFGGNGMPAGVCTIARRSAALRRVGLKLRMPSRARVDSYVVHNPRVFLDQAVALAVWPLGALFSIVGTVAMLQWPRSPRSRPKKPRFSNSVSSRSVFARRYSRQTGTLEGWIT